MAYKHIDLSILNKPTFGQKYNQRTQRWEFTPDEKAEHKCDLSLKNIYNSETLLIYKKQMEENPDIFDKNHIFCRAYKEFHFTDTLKVDFFDILTLAFEIIDSKVNIKLINMDKMMYNHTVDIHSKFDDFKLIFRTRSNFSVSKTCFHLPLDFCKSDGNSNFDSVYFGKENRKYFWVCNTIDNIAEMLYRTYLRG